MPGWNKMSLGMEGLRRGDFVLDGDPAPLPKKGAEPPIFGPCLLWPNGCMDQDATWCEDRPRPSDTVLDGDPAPSPKRRQRPPPIFGSCLLWPNDCMDQYATWYGGRPRSRPHCAGWGPSSPAQKGGAAPQLLAHVYCAQTAGWIKMPLSMKVGLDPSDIV